MSYDGAQQGNGEPKQVGNPVLKLTFLCKAQNGGKIPKNKDMVIKQIVALMMTPEAQVLLNDGFGVYDIDVRYELNNL